MIWLLYYISFNIVIFLINLSEEQEKPTLNRKEAIEIFSFILFFGMPLFIYFIIEDSIEKKFNKKDIIVLIKYMLFDKSVYIHILRTYIIFILCIHIYYFIIY